MQENQFTIFLLFVLPVRRAHLDMFEKLEVIEGRCCFIAREIKIGYCSICWCDAKPVVMDLVLILCTNSRARIKETFAYTLYKIQTANMRSSAEIYHATFE
jgi:hypothetical protein